jgi:hypothetical protein
MPIYFVATRARYVLVNADDEVEARRLGEPMLYDLYAEVRRELGRDMPITIHTVRLATPDEIELQRWHDEMVARESR